MKDLNKQFGSMVLKQWNGQNSLWFKMGNKNVFIDPFNVPNEAYEPMDIIFISHDHFDHLQKTSLDKIVTAGKTKVYTPSSCVDAVSTCFSGEVVSFDIGDSMMIGNVKVEAYPAYGIQRAQLHPKEKGWVSLGFSDEQTSIFITSDTERIPEFKQIQADVVILPVGPRFTFVSVQEAIDTVLDLGGKVAIPVHHSMMPGEGTQEDMAIFKKGLAKKGVSVLDVVMCGDVENLDEDQLAVALG